MKFDAEEFKANLVARLRRQYGKDFSQATKHDLFDAVSASALEIIMPNWMETRREYEAKNSKQLYYLSAEFLMGRALSNDLINSGIMEGVKESTGIDVNALISGVIGGKVAAKAAEKQNQTMKDKPPTEWKLQRFCIERI